MTKLDGAALAEVAGSRYGPTRRFSPEVAKERNRDRTRRHAAAQQRAYAALSRLHPDEYEALRVHFLDQINTERGSLPGDE